MFENVIPHSRCLIIVILETTVTFFIASISMIKSTEKDVLTALRTTRKLNLSSAMSWRPCVRALWGTHWALTV